MEEKDETPLKSGSEASVEDASFLAKPKFDENAYQDFSEAIMRYKQGNDLSEIKGFLQQGFNPLYVLDSENGPIFFHAIDRNNKGLLAFIASFDNNKFKNDILYKVFISRRLLTALEYTSEMCDDGAKDVIMWFFEQGLDFFKPPVEGKVSYMHGLLIDENYGSFKEIVDNDPASKAKVLDSKNGFLHFAVEKGLPDAYEMLLQMGVEPNGIDSEGVIAFAYARYYEEFKDVQEFWDEIIFHDKFDIKKQDKSKRSTVDYIALTAKKDKEVLYWVTDNKARFEKLGCYDEIFSKIGTIEEPSVVEKPVVVESDVEKVVSSNFHEGYNTEDNWSLGESELAKTTNPEEVVEEEQAPDGKSVQTSSVDVINQPSSSEISKK